MSWLEEIIHKMPVIFQLACFTDFFLLDINSVNHKSLMRHISLLPRIDKHSIVQRHLLKHKTLCNFLEIMQQAKIIEGGGKESYSAF